MIQIIFDTETTGLNPANERIVELGAIKIKDKQPTGEVLHLYFNPEKIMSDDVIKIHGISNEKAQTFPTFKDQLKKIEAFFKDKDVTEIIAHNLSFDLSFMNEEFKRAKSRFRLNDKKYILTDSLIVAREKLKKDLKKFSLDALCNFYKIDKTEREKYGHGALLDSKLLLEVWIKLNSEQVNLFDQEDNLENEELQNTKDIQLTKNDQLTETQTPKNYSNLNWISIQLSEQDMTKHLELLAKLNKK